MSLDPGFLIASLLVSGVGFVVFSYGRTQRRLPHALIGVVMLIYPYFVTNVPHMLALVPVLLAVLWLMIRFGM
jgi:hypothetical protein